MAIKRSKYQGAESAPVTTGKPDASDQSESTARETVPVPKPVMSLVRAADTAIAGLSGANAQRVYDELSKVNDPTDLVAIYRTAGVTEFASWLSGLVVSSVLYDRIARQWETDKRPDAEKGTFVQALETFSDSVDLGISKTQWYADRRTFKVFFQPMEAPTQIVETRNGKQTTRKPNAADLKRHAENQAAQLAEVEEDIKTLKSKVLLDIAIRAAAVPTGPAKTPEERKAQEEALTISARAMLREMATLADTMPNGILTKSSALEWLESKKAAQKEVKEEVIISEYREKVQEAQKANKPAPPKPRVLVEREYAAQAEAAQKAGKPVPPEPAELAEAPVAFRNVTVKVDSDTADLLLVIGSLASIVSEASRGNKKPGAVYFVYRGDNGIWTSGTDKPDGDEYLVYHPNKGGMFSKEYDSLALLLFPSESEQSEIINPPAQEEAPAKAPVQAPSKPVGTRNNDPEKKGKAGKAASPAPVETVADAEDEAPADVDTEELTAFLAEHGIKA